MCFNFMSANLCLKAKPGTRDLLHGMFELAMAGLTVLAGELGLGAELEATENTRASSGGLANARLWDLIEKLDPKLER